MKKTLFLVAVVGLALAGAVWLTAVSCSASHERELAAQREAWAAERAELEAALEQARTARARAGLAIPATPPSTLLAARPSPAEIIERITSLAGSPAARWRAAVYWLEELALTGPAALPAIRDYFSRNEEVEFDTAWFQGRPAREGKLPTDLVAPISLRLGMIDVIRRIGGEPAEALLSEILRSTVRGVEAAWVTRALHELAPGKYRDAAVGAARALLASSAALNSASPLDRYHREHLFGVLAFYGDTGYAVEAQSQLVRADNQVDRAALRYLQQSLGSQAVSVVAQAYQNPALGTNASAKEPLARLALNFVGADPQANRFWSQAINDPVLTKDHRRNLIEDLNQDGFADTRNLTQNDLPLIQERMSLIEQLAPNSMDQVNAEAFAEAYKDLVNMRAKITGQPPASRP